jgi:isochorismate synthase
VRWPSSAPTARPLGEAFDLLAAYDPSTPERSFFLERSGLGLAGVGSICVTVEAAGRDQLSAARAAVNDVFRSVRPEPGGREAIVAGAFPFDGSSPAPVLLMTRYAARFERGSTWRVDVRAPEDDERRAVGQPVRRPVAPPSAAFADGQLQRLPDPSVYGRAVEEATRRIGAGELRKVVLARAVQVRAGRELDPRTLVWRLRAVDPDCFAFAAPTSAGVLVGATPELLVARHGTDVTAKPLAGSAPRFGDSAEDRASGERLLASRKDREEHDIVVRAVADGLRRFCEHLDVASEPALLGTANVWHLSTRFRGRLRAPAADALELVTALHPTPAVCGVPEDAARSTIAGLEPFDRGCYSGPVGWMNADGDGEWAVALRCAELRGSRARLFAGAGIVAGSRPDAELDETERKFRALLDALRWG